MMKFSAWRWAFWSEVLAEAFYFGYSYSRSHLNRTTKKVHLVGRSDSSRDFFSMMAGGIRTLNLLVFFMFVTAIASFSSIYVNTVPVWTILGWYDPRWPIFFWGVGNQPTSMGRPWDDLCKFWPKTSLQSSSWHLSVFSFLPKSLKHSTLICFGFCNVWSVWLVARCFSPPARWGSLDFNKRHPSSTNSKGTQPPTHHTTLTPSQASLLASMSSPACVPATSTQPLYRKLATSLLGPLDPNPMPDEMREKMSENIWITMSVKMSE